MNFLWVIKHFSLLTGSSQYDTFCSMSKKRKTRKEKIVSQERKANLITQNTETGTIYSFESSSTQKTIPTSPDSKTSYAYVINDMIKSLAITMFILLVSIILFTLIQANIIRLSSLGY